MNDKHREVSEWLGKVFGNESVPQYEINPRVIDILHELMRVNERKDKQAPLIIQDLTQKAEEYANEGERLRGKLSEVGLTTSALSQSGIASLRTVCNVAQVLDAQDTSDTSLLLAMSDFTLTGLKLQDLRRTEQKQCEQLLNSTKSALHKLRHLQRSYSGVKEAAKTQGGELEKKTKQAGFLRSKASEYRKHVHKLQIEFVQSGGSSEIYHSELVKRSEALKQLQEELQPLKAKLDSYHKLPPDMSLSRVKVEECKRELASIEEELARHIDLMHT